VTFNPVRTNQFKKDYRMALKRGRNMEKLHELLGILASGRNPGLKHRDHLLAGSFAGRRECHIEPDWLLIYKVDGSDIIFERTGTHSDLFR
jgi:mRNA interferase YafQ